MQNVLGLRFDKTSDTLSNELEQADKEYTWWCQIEWTKMIFQPLNLLN